MRDRTGFDPILPIFQLCKVGVKERFIQNFIQIVREDCELGKSIKKWMEFGFSN